MAAGNPYPTPPHPLPADGAARHGARPYIGGRTEGRGGNVRKLARRTARDRAAAWITARQPLRGRQTGKGSTATARGKAGKAGKSATVAGRRRGLFNNY